MPNPLTIPVTAGTPAVILGWSPAFPVIPITGVIGIAVATMTPTHVVGLVPLTECDDEECRTFYEVCKDCNVVFGESGTLTATYENDWNTFLLDYSLYLPNPSGTILFKLQKYVSGAWVDSLTLNNDNNGKFYDLESIPNHDGYTGYGINWGAVLGNVGVGIYRFRVESTFGLLTSCLVSPAFELRAWDCNRAKGTVKFENWLTGVIGEKRIDYQLYDLCTMWWYDSIRVKGWFGYYKVPEYKEVLLEWGSPNHGKIQRVRDEAIQGFEYLSNYQKFEIHERFSVYGMMADELRVSDYNLNNSDYSIKRLLVVKDGGYEPEYIDNKGQRRSKVKMRFKRGVQGVIKSNCCTVAGGVG